MTNNIPTESRIFASQYFREAKRIEALHASRLVPGAEFWLDAMSALWDRMDKSKGGPIKEVATLKRAIATMNAIPRDEAMHIGFTGHASGKRTAALVFAAFSPTHHPIKGFDHEDGLSVVQHAITISRSGAYISSGRILTFISRHAVARLHERNHKLDAGSAYRIFGYLGILGLLVRTSEKHAKSDISLLYDDMICVGTVRRGIMMTRDNKMKNGTFLDVRTVLPADDVRDRTALCRQGKIAHNVVAEWLIERDPSTVDRMAESIPFLPQRDDYIARTARTFKKLAS